MSSWPTEELAARAWQIAEGMSGLLEDPTAWRHRRTERYELKSAEEILHRVSVDFTVPRDLWGQLQLRPEPAANDRNPATTGRDGQWVVPLGWVKRGPLVGFDLRQDGASLPLLLATEIETITRNLLDIWLEVALAATGQSRDSAMANEAAALIDGVSGFDVETSIPNRIGAFAEEYEAPVTGLCELMRTAASGFLLLALVPRVDRRQVIKFAHVEAVPVRRRRTSFWFEAPSVLDAASSHFECPLPVELRAAEWYLAVGQDRQIAGGPRNSDHPALYATAALAARELASLGASARSLAIRAEYRVEAWRFHVPAASLALVACALVAYGAFGTDLGEMVDRGHQGPVVTVLLASVALFLALLLRLDEHSLARRLLLVPRVLLLVVLVAVLGAAATLAFGVRHVGDVWFLCSVVAGTSTLLLVATIPRAARSTTDRAGRRRSGAPPPAAPYSVPL
jgi:hypothetical protein